MGAFNVTSLSDWGYNETTKFIDPMEERWRSKNVEASAFTEQGIQKRLQEFYMLDAYRKVDDVEAALLSYYANGPPKTTLTSSSVKNNAASTKTTTTRSSVATVAKLDDKKTSSTKKTTTTRRK